MSTEHLSEMIIQQYAIEPSTCETRVQAHILACEHCRLKAEGYKLLFREMKDLPKPVFDFDLSGLVTGKLPVREPDLSWTIIGICVFSVVCMASAAYIYRSSLMNIFTGISVILLCLIVISALIILIFQGVDIYKSYEQKIRSLNIY